MDMANIVGITPRRLAARKMMQKIAKVMPNNGKTGYSIIESDGGFHCCITDHRGIDALEWGPFNTRLQALRSTREYFARRYECRRPGCSTNTHRVNDNICATCRELSVINPGDGASK